jgi:hypothetical protein
LNCNREFLSFVLREMDRSLLLLIKLEHYIEKQRYGDDGVTGGNFVHSWLVATVDQSLQVTLVEPSDADRDAVMRLDERSRYSLRDRLRALGGSGS